jgi:hypothetical protein
MEKSGYVMFIPDQRHCGVLKHTVSFLLNVYVSPGWSKTWDEWVTDERLLKINPENLERQKEVEKEIQASKGQTPPSNYTCFLSIMSSVSDPGPGGQK